MMNSDSENTGAAAPNLSDLKPSETSRNPGEVGAWRELDADALRHNLAVLRRACEPQKSNGCPQMWPAAKANAYGHSAQHVLGILNRLPQGERPEGLCVARPVEALQLRQWGWTGRTLVLSPIAGAIDPELLRGEIELVYSMTEHLPAIEKAAREAGTQARVHLKVDTGMGRIGCKAAEVAQLIEAARSSEELHLVGVMSHLARADEMADPAGAATTQGQIAAFMEVKAEVEAMLPEAERPLFHLANSAAILEQTKACGLDIVRPGLAIYGMLPSPEIKLAHELRRVLTLKARVEGRSGREVAIAIGARDGLHPGIVQDGAITINGHTCPIKSVEAGHTLIELPAKFDGHLGKHVNVIGDETSAENLAAAAGTINYEITTRLSASLLTKIF